MAYFGELPWHRLGTALEEADLYDWPSASRKAGLDWEFEQYRRLARRSINQGDLRKYVRRVLKVESEEDISTRSKNLVEEVVRLAETGRGNNLPSIRDTYWSAYNGVLEWLTYSRGRSDDSRLNSLWFGASALANRHALEVALDMAG
jgi:hypothetical protein